MFSRRVARIWKRGCYFERVRKVETTLTRIFIVLESVSHGISRNSRNFKHFICPKSGDLKKKKRSSPILKLIFWPKSEIRTFEGGGCFPMGGAIFNFSPKIGLKSTKNVRFCILHKPMGKLEPPPLATLLMFSTCWLYR